MKYSKALVVVSLILAGSWAQRIRNDLDAGQGGWAVAHSLLALGSLAVALYYLSTLKQKDQ